MPVSGADGCPVVLAIRIGLALTLAVVVAAAVVLPSQKRADGPPVLRGLTEQGHPISLTLTAGGAVADVVTRIDASCANGRTISGNLSAAGPQRTDRGRETWSDGTRVRTTARTDVAADGRSGRVGYSAHLHQTDGQNVICRSGPVSFTAR